VIAGKVMRDEMVALFERLRASFRDRESLPE
jgi:hypothetical protein